MMGWVTSDYISRELGWVGSVKSWVGLGWVTENGPTAMSGLEPPTHPSTDMPTLHFLTVDLYDALLPRSTTVC